MVPVTISPRFRAAAPLLFWLLVVFLPQSPVAAQSRRHQQFLDRREHLLTQLQQQLSGVRDRCAEQGLPTAAQEIEALQVRIADPRPVVITSVPATPPLDPQLPEQELQWRQQLIQLRQQSGSELYRLARQALQRGELPSVAYQLIGDVLKVNPDQANARRVVGQILFQDPLRADEPGYAGEWVSRFESRKRGGRIPEVLHPRYGWIDRRHINRYDQGERYFKGRWISVGKEEGIRRDFRHAWEVESEHFLVKTNVSLEAGVELTQRLEIYLRWLKSTFAAFFETPQDLQRQFLEAHRPRGRGHAVPRMEVYYYRTQDEYRRAIHNKVPANVAAPPNGLYWQPEHRSYFFASGDPSDWGTVYHEATHQILDVYSRHDRRAVERAMGRRRGQRQREWVLGGDAGFWLIEGLACYFESFEETPDGIDVGRPDHIRFVNAQVRLLSADQRHFFFPFRQLDALGKQQFQTHPGLPQLYSQSSGMAHFLMHYENGLYRDDVVELLSALYRPNPRRPLPMLTLAQATGVPFAQLEQQYRDHMQQLALQTRPKSGPPAADTPDPRGNEVKPISQPRALDRQWPRKGLRTAFPEIR